MASDDIVLITGSSGYLGAAIVRKLADEYTLVGLDRPGGPAPPSSAHQIDLDLGSDKSVGEALGQVRAKFGGRIARSEEHTSELQSLMRSSYAVFCLKKQQTQ